MEPETLRKAAGRTLHVGVLLFFTVALAFPFFWMLIATFKQNIDLYTVENNPFLFNLPPTLDHLRLLFGETRFLRWLGNTALARGPTKSAGTGHRHKVAQLMHLHRFSLSYT